MRVLLNFYILLLLSINAISAQSELKFGERLILGNSLTYIPFNEDGLRNTYHELTWNKNIALNLTKSLYLGLSYQNIFTKGSSYIISEKKENYSLVGIFLQYDLIPKKKDRILLELSWNYGNYCTCGFRDPYKEEWIDYIGVGGSYEMRLNKFISAEVGLYFYDILEPIEAKYAFTQYVLGLNIDLISK